MKQSQRTCLWVIVVVLMCVARLDAQVVDRIVAVVNGDIITLHELEQQIRRSADPRNEQNLAADPSARQQFLDIMINDILLRQEAERLKIEVTDTEVENEVRQFKVSRRLSEDEFAHSLKLQNMTVEQFKTRTRQDIMKHRMISYMVRRKVVVTDEEIAAYHAKHPEEFRSDRTVSLQMLVAPNQESATALHASIASGKTTFNDAVSSSSTGPRQDFGVIGEVRWNELAPDWQSALNAVPVGQMTTPFPVQGQWVVLKVLDERQGSEQSLGEVQERVREVVMRPKLEARFQEYMSDLRSKALIEKKL
ncbi:SurA N-terminal domain-containing protein [Desulfovibrionales bacterium]